MAQIQVAANDRRIVITAILNQTDFLFDFPAGAEAELTVTKKKFSDEVVSNPAFTAVFTANGGTVTIAAQLAGDIITIEGTRTQERSSNFLPGGEFRADDINADINLLTKAIQEDRRDLGRTMQLPPEVADAVDTTLPEPVAGDGLVWNSSADALESKPGLADVVSGPGAGGSTDNTIARYDGTDGDIQTSGVVIDDGNNMSGMLNIDTSPTGRVDSRLIATDGAKLDGISSGAEVNPDLIPQAEAEAGVATTERVISAERLKQAIDALSGGVVLARIAGSTFSTIQHLQDIFHSTGSSSGGLVTDAGSNTIDVASGTGFIRATDSDLAEVLFFDWPAETGLSVPSGTTRFIGIQYNAGTPNVVISATNNFDATTTFHLATCVNEGGTIHISNTPHKVGDHASAMILRSHEAMGIQRDNVTGGLILGETGTRNVTMSAGKLWDRLAKFTLSAIDTSAAGTYDRYFTTAPGVHTKQVAETQWDNTQWNDVTSGLVTLGANKYSNEWFYLELEGELLSMYGDEEFNSLAEAENAQPPADVPDRITQLATLIGRIIFKKSDATAQDIESSFDVTFGGAVVTSHSSLANLSADDHLQYILANGSRAFSDTVTITPSGDDALVLTNGQLQLTLGDIILTSGMFQGNKGADVIGATELPLISDGNFVNVTGTTTITSIATTFNIGTFVTLQFDASLTLTHNATDLILPGGVNIQTEAGDIGTFVEYASGDFVCVSYQRYIELDVESMMFAVSDETTALTTGTAKLTFRMPYAFTLTEVRTSVTTAPTDATLIVDINDGGTSIMTTDKLDILTTATIDDGTVALTDTALADKAVITIDIDQIGSSVAGAGLKVYFIGRRA